MWFFWRNSIPRDIQIGQPNPSSWGKYVTDHLPSGIAFTR
jgi:hypothetical protein